MPAPRPFAEGEVLDVEAQVHRQPGAAGPASISLRWRRISVAAAAALSASSLPSSTRWLCATHIGSPAGLYSAISSEVVGSSSSSMRTNSGLPLSRASSTWKAPDRRIASRWSPAAVARSSASTRRFRPATCAFSSEPARRRTTSHSTTRRASNTCAPSARVGSGTCAPRLGRSTTTPSCASRCSAWRTSVRETAKVCASSSSRSRAPGGRRWSITAA
jgi:hypothetical protein